MKVKELKEMLQEYVYILKQYEDNDEINMVTNTYFLSNNRVFLGMSGYNGGYISLANLEEEIITGEEDDDDDED